MSVAWQIGGTAGEGLESGGEAFARALAGMGYRPSTQRDFPSRIRGGDTTYTVRLTAGGFLAPPPHVDVALAFNDTVLPRMLAKVTKDSLFLIDGHVTKPDTAARVVQLDFSAIAKQAGLPKAKNVVALGASAAILQIDVEALADAVANQYAHKGDDVVQANRRAVLAGFEAAQGLPTFALPAPDKQEVLFLSGNEAASLGALAAGCRFAAAYPITPASDVLEYLTPRLKSLNGFAMQMEDEMAALNACIGAGFAGARGLTATSGPGLSLMTETIGLAASTETPVVIFDCQRPGPSTGMPTKHGQEDLWHLCLGGHGEDVRIVIAPMDVEDAFLGANELFRLAWKFRAPGFLALDQQCSLMKQTVAPFDTQAASARHTKREPRTAQSAWLGGKPYGGGPVTIPGEDGVYLANSTEHGPTGFTTEDPIVRADMVDRRRAIMQQIIQDTDPIHVEGEGDVAVVACGSTVGAVREACEGKARVVAIKLLWPFPVDAVKEAIGDRRVVVAEANGFAQLSSLVRMHLPVHDRLTECLRYDGTPVQAQDVEACL